MILKTHSQKVDSTTSQKVEKSKTTFKTSIVAMALGLMASVSPMANAFPIGQSSYSHPGGWTLAEVSQYGATKGLPYKNVHIYRLHNEETYVQLVDFSQGGHIKINAFANSAKINGFKSWNRQSMVDWWKHYNDQTSRVSVVNGTFFNHERNPTTLSFGIRVDGRVLDEGSDVNANGGYNLKQMNFYGDRVEVVNYTADSLKNTSAPNAIVGKSPWSREKEGESIGRTYLCARPMFQSGVSSSSHVLLVYTAKAKTQQWAEADLNSWGCTDVNTVMLDGSKSTKLRTKGGINMEGNGNKIAIFEPGERYVPQVITIFN